MTFFIDSAPVAGNEGTHPLTFVGRKIFDDKIISDIEEYISHQELEESKILHMNKNPDSDWNVVDAVTSDKARSSMIHWMNDEKYKDFLMPIYDHIARQVRMINGGMWKYNYDGYGVFQYSEYTEGDHFNWHIDQITITGESRKISFSLGISDETEYEGGDLGFKTGDLEEDYYKIGRGDIIVFPSWMLHKVTPVTKGKRRVLVGWGEGLIL